MMLKTVLSVLIACCMLPFTANAGEDASAVDYLKKIENDRVKTGLVYDMDVESTDGTLTYKTYAQDGKWRMDGEIGSQTTRVLFDGQKTVIIIDNTALEQKVDNFSALPSQEEASDFVLGEKSNYGGYDCQMLRSDTKKTDLCLYEKYALPVYVKTAEFTMSVTNVTAEKLDSALFDLPKGLDVINLQDLKIYGQ